jgi:hypothetical protein
MTTVSLRFSLLAGLMLAAAACGDDDGGDGGGGGGGNESPEQTGKSCMVADDCYPDVDHAELAGAVQCLDRVRDGYCTHLCETDDDCCAAEGECETGLRQVCAPFESTGQRMCFLSCEGSDLRAADASTSGDVDDQEFCQREASSDFICRSSGGGAQNRKVCVPGDCGVGADCGGDADCDTDLECVEDLAGGYCGRRDCEADADCPGDSVCVEDDGNTYCLRTCTGETDCSFCRHPDQVATCTDAVTFVEATGVRVCLP